MPQVQLEINSDRVVIKGTLEVSSELKDHFHHLHDKAAMNLDLQFALYPLLSSGLGIFSARCCSGLQRNTGAAHRGSTFNFVVSAISKEGVRQQRTSDQK